MSIYRHPKQFTEGEWHFLFGVTSNPWWQYRQLGWYQFHIGLFRLEKCPPNGTRIDKKCYRGFWFQLSFWLPFHIDQWR